MKIYGDYHTHTKYSDGYTTVRENLEAAREKGLSAIGISDHGFNSPSLGALTPKTFLEQKEEIDGLREEFRDLRIYHAIEANIIGEDGTIDLRPSHYPLVDYIIAGFHAPTKPKSFRAFRKLYLNSYFSFLIKPSKSVIERNTKAYVNMVKNNPIAIIAHINHLTKVDAVEVAKCCADYGTMIELNAKHVDLSPSFFEGLLSTEVILIANSDGHRTNEIGEVTKIKEYLLDYPEANSRIININQLEISFRSPIN